MRPFRVLPLILLLPLLLGISSCRFNEDEDDPTPVSTFERLISLSTDADSIDFYVELFPGTTDAGRSQYHYEVQTIGDFSGDTDSRDLNLEFLDETVQGTNSFTYNPASGLGQGSFTLSAIEGALLQFHLRFDYTDGQGQIHHNTYAGSITGCHPITRWEVSTDESLFDADVTVGWVIAGDNGFQGAWVWSRSPSGTQVDEDAVGFPTGIRACTFRQGCVEDFGTGSTWGIEVITGSYYYGNRMLAIHSSSRTTGTDDLTPDPASPFGQKAIR